jgi:hypothetical protein
VTEKQLAKRRQSLEAFTKEILAPLGRSECHRWGSVYVRAVRQKAMMTGAVAFAPAAVAFQLRSAIGTAEAVVVSDFSLVSAHGGNERGSSEDPQRLV